jgi:hypothetical protein
MTTENVLVNIADITNLQPLSKTHTLPEFKQQIMTRSFNLSIKPARTGQKC